MFPPSNPHQLGTLTLDGTVQPVLDALAPALSVRRVAAIYFTAPTGNAARVLVGNANLNGGTFAGVIGQIPPGDSFGVDMEGNQLDLDRLYVTGTSGDKIAVSILVV